MFGWRATPPFFHANYSHVISHFLHLQPRWRIFTQMHFVSRERCITIRLLYVETTRPTYRSAIMTRPNELQDISRIEDLWIRGMNIHREKNFSANWLISSQLRFVSVNVAHAAKILFLCVFFAALIVSIKYPLNRSNRSGSDIARVLVLNFAYESHWNVLPP